MFEHIAFPKVIAHRGASNYAPENTLAAFELSSRQGADGVELDVKLSADGHVIIIHDSTVDRTTDGTGKVAEFSLDALRELDAGVCFDETFRGEKIPLLDEVFESLGKKLFINVELTNYSTPFDKLPDKVAQVVKRHNMTERVLFSSFNPLTLYRIHRLLPNSPIGLLMFKGNLGKLGRVVFGNLLPVASLHPHFEDTTSKLIKDAHNKAMRVYPYTVNQAEDIQHMFKKGVDGIITDDPILTTNLMSKT